MKRFKKYLRDLGIAFDNLWRELTTPRHITADEQTARELLTKARSLGVYPKQLSAWMQMFMTVCADDEQVKIMATIIAKGQYDHEDLRALEQTGIRFKEDHAGH